MSLLATAIAAGGAISALAVIHAKRAGLSRMVADTLVEAGDLVVVEQSGFGAVTTGRIGDVEVRIHAPALHYVAVEMKVRPRRECWIVRRTIPPGPARPSGDRTFDAAFVSGGDPMSIASVLRHDVRGALLDSRIERISITGEHLIIDGFWGTRLPQDMPELRRQILAGVRVVERLPAAAAPRTLVINNARRDPDPLVRLANLVLVLDPTTATGALDDEDPRVRVVGAAFLDAFDRVGEADAIEAVVDPNPRVLDAALTILAATGTQRALAALRRVPAAHRQSVRRWRWALESIQTRIGSTGEGELSLRGTDANGDLSLLRSEIGGELGLPDPKTDDGSER